MRFINFLEHKEVIVVETPASMNIYDISNHNILSKK